MSHLIVLAVVLVAALLVACSCAVDGPAETASGGFERDTFTTSAGELGITFIGHGTLMLDWDGNVIHVDPYGKLADYAKLPKADLVLITHEHHDHLDADALAKIRTDATQLVLTEKCAASVDGGIIMKNGDDKTVAGVAIRAVPAYNLVHKRPSGDPFHPKGEGNGYVLSIGETKIYVAGDTEDIPEMAELKDIDIAFLPMNLPYTMSPEMAAKAARSFMPKILYPYHFGATDCSALTALLEDTPQIEVRIRKMK